MGIFTVIVSKKAMKQVGLLPLHIQFKLQGWIDGVENDGLMEMRKIPGFHDEPLKGVRAGQRSIRLNKAYRAIYMICADGSLEFVEVIEVNKHEY